MIPMPTAGTAELLREAAIFNTKVAAGVQKLSAIKDAQVQIATTPKDEVFRTDKVTLYRYRPLAEPRVKTPVLIVYSLIGRYTMTDLQEDRSLIRNLLKQGFRHRTGRIARITARNGNTRSIRTGWEWPASA
jgi:polyhydroxyalkanoate synthase